MQLFNIMSAAGAGEQDQATITATDTGGLQVSDQVKFTIQAGSGAQLGFPRVGAIVYDRAWMANDATAALFRAELAKCDVLVIGLFAQGDWDSANPSGLSREEGYNALRALNPNIYIFNYTSTHEFSTAQAVEQDLQDWVEGNAAFSGGVPGNWDANNFYARNSGGNKINTFGGSPDVLNVNITQYPDLTDAQGRQYPQFYADWTDSYMFGPVNTPKDGNPGSVGPFMDVTDPSTKTSNYDADASGGKATPNEDPQRNWNNASFDPDGAEISRQWRQGHRNTMDRWRTQHPNMLIFGNCTLHLNNAFLDGNGDPIPRYSETDMSVLPVVIDEYWKQFNGGYIENNSKGNFPESGVRADGTVGGGAPGTYNSQLVYNRYVQQMLATAPPNLAMMDWAAELTPHPISGGDVDPTGFVPTGGPFHVLRRGLAMVLMDDGIFHGHFSQSTFRTIAWIDETGIANTGTTGLSKGWLGQPIDPPQRAPRVGRLWWREFEGGLALWDDGVDHFSSNVSTVIAADLPGGLGTFKFINGVQAPAVNTGAVINSNFTCNQADGRILQRV